MNLRCTKFWMSVNCEPQLQSDIGGQNLKNVCISSFRIKATLILNVMIYTIYIVKLFRNTRPTGTNNQQNMGKEML